MNKQNIEVDKFIANANAWQKELEKLRSILLECDLTEQIKWMHPCYTINNKNIALIHGFKEYCALLFMKGSLLKDTEGILIQQTENVQSGRQIRFANLKEIKKLEATIKAYIFEAIEVEKAGLKVVHKKTEEYEIPEELQQKLYADSNFKKAFEALTPGRQRGYILFFSSTQQSKTRISRIEKYNQRIMNGQGLNDCVCGFSKRMPNCDGSHKFHQ
jgi:uncharacterized protein YdeI (YjbR/CyaY-like superfamily)